ncbi:MAG TPA: GNAT family N-acetyltransferase [Kangiella sp.]
MIIAETERLRIRHLQHSDANFIYQLYNQPNFIKYIGDRGVHSPKDAEVFIQKVQDNYKHYGFWLYLAERKDNGKAVGVNGLIKRDYLDAPDIGFAFITQFCGQGYAQESSQAILQHSKAQGQTNLYAITSPNNHVSEHLLKKLGFEFQRQDYFDNSTSPINLFKLLLQS